MQLAELLRHAAPSAECGLIAVPIAAEPNNGGDARSDRVLAVEPDPRAPHNIVLAAQVLPILKRGLANDAEIAAPDLHFWPERWGGYPNLVRRMGDAQL